ncbi:hypothetical protein NE237_000055 [Protea cynaroides]|uniref:Uncharacterized protein n=1 Tax=Protea cynaroides TaxID=273540 RepID=A0A9Q0GN07_9MAGN|nr:hypothetical protein NE237_000055 [Protea cynaroides]
MIGAWCNLQTPVMIIMISAISSRFNDRSREQSSNASDNQDVDPKKFNLPGYAVSFSTCFVVTTSVLVSVTIYYGAIFFEPYSVCVPMIRARDSLQTPVMIRACKLAWWLCYQGMRILWTSLLPGTITSTGQNMLMKAPELLRLNQAYGAEFQHEAIALEAMTGRRGQIIEATKVSLSLENAGRSILVEGGIGEQQPSMDVRHPWNQDSDVVIQVLWLSLISLMHLVHFPFIISLVHGWVLIAVNDSSGNFTGWSKQEGHEDDVVLEIYKN